MPSTRRFAHACLTATLMAFALTANAQNALNISTGSPSTVVAKQGTATVTLADVDAFAARMPEKERGGFFDNPQRLEQMLMTLLVQKQLADEARKAGLDKDPAVKTQVDLAVDDALAKARMARLRTDMKLPDFSKLAQEEYAAHKEKYAIPGKLSVKHVLIEAKTRTDEEAKALAEKVAADAKAHPGTFDALVEKYSEDQSKANNKGLMPDVATGKYAPAFVEASKKLKKPGEISPVVRTKFGYHVIELVERTPDQQQAFAQVRDKIVEQLRSDYIDKTAKTHADELRNQPIDANSELVASLRTRYGTRPEAPADGAPTPAQ